MARSLSHFLSSRVVYSVMFYLLLVTLVVVAHPGIAFNTDGSVKPFGVGAGKSVFSLGTLVSSMSVVCFYVFCLIDVIFKG